MLFRYFLAGLTLATNLQAALFQVPPAQITDEGKRLIFAFEGCDLFPQWAEGASGVDIGYGYDFGYYPKETILLDWQALPVKSRNALAESAGVTGRKAKSLAIALHWVRIWEGAAESVFLSRDLPREYDRCKRAFPGFDALRPNAQAALISLGYNRGYGMTGDGRREMRAIRDLCPRADYNGIAGQLRAMRRLWRGTSIELGMTRRRNAEADLLLRP